MSSTPKYDSISDGYSTYKQVGPYVKYVQRPSLLRALGDLKGRKVLDMGCGEGCYCRDFAKLGATKVVGVDLSTEILKVAKEYEATHHLGIEYMEYDSRQLPKLGDFDIVCAAYLLNEMTSCEDLNKTCQSLSRNLKNGGKLVGLVHYEKVMDTADFKGEEPFKAPVSFFDPSGKVLSEIIDNCFRKATYEKALNNAGFTDIHWSPVEISKEGLEVMGEDFFQWKMVRDNPDHVFWAYKHQ